MNQRGLNASDQAVVFLNGSITLVTRMSGLGGS